MAYLQHAPAEAWDMLLLRLLQARLGWTMNAMTDDRCLKIAEDYLLSRSIEYVRPGRIACKERDRWEAVFLHKVLDPAIATVDPPDVRVWVNLVDGQVEWIFQM